MKLHQKIRINETGTEIINFLNSGTKHEQYTGRIVCKCSKTTGIDWLVEIDQHGVNTFKTARMFTELNHITDKAFVYLHESFFELI